MSTHESTSSFDAGHVSSFETGHVPAASRVRVGTVVWGLIIVALAILNIISNLGLVILDGNYVLIGLMIGAGAALVIGGLISARSRKSGAGSSSGDSAH
ncbi:hypothetical protein [Arthrobacter sp. NyZ413]|uniref:hypothetical protein n=1 Tax=Arthrobacter sp. NyZ413 TaxID=3144669 RepID=UPI002C57AD79|nr:hypothetical protein [Arthrobacter sp.]